MRPQEGCLAFTFEYEAYAKDDRGFVECRITYNFHPGSPETGRYSGPPENYDPAHEVEYLYAEREVIGAGGGKHWSRLHPGEFLDEQCQAYLHAREKCDLIEGLPNGGDPDPDATRDAREDRRLMERDEPVNWGDDCD